MKRLKSVESDEVELEVIECDCGYHMGIDATFLDQVGDFKTKCPSCNAEIDTHILVVIDFHNLSKCRYCGIVLKDHHLSTYPTCVKQREFMNQETNGLLNNL